MWTDNYTRFKCYNRFNFVTKTVMRRLFPESCREKWFVRNQRLVLEIVHAELTGVEENEFLSTISGYLEIDISFSGETNSSWYKLKQEQFMLELEERMPEYRYFDAQPKVDLRTFSTCMNHVLS